VGTKTAQLAGCVHAEVAKKNTKQKTRNTLVNRIAHLPDPKKITCPPQLTGAEDGVIRVVCHPYITHSLPHPPLEREGIFKLGLMPVKGEGG